MHTCTIFLTCEATSSLIKDGKQEIRDNRHDSTQTAGPHTQMEWISNESDILAQLVFHKQVLPPDVFTRVTIWKYVARLDRKNYCTNSAQNLLNRL
jgi:hypothetical protein